jgi:hypothetical protein
MSRIPTGCDILGPVLVAAPLEAAVSSPAIDVDDAALGYRRSNASLEAAGCNVGDRRHPNPPDLGPCDLCSDHHNSLRLVCLPMTPRSTPPTYVSSISTSPANRSRPGEPWLGEASGANSQA